jgi:hypothetical protein
LFIVPGVMVSVHVDAVHAPLYPENDAMPAGDALSVTTTFGGKVVAQVPPVTPFVTVQLMPAGTLVTVPLPEPPPATAMPCVWNIASAVRPWVIASWHGSETQSPAHAANTALPVVTCCSVTTVFAAKNAVHVPLVVEPLSTQLIPVGALVITPPPADPGPAVTVSRCGAALNAALTCDVTPVTLAIAHDPPVHAPLNPSKLPLLLLPAISVTVLPASNVALQIPLATPAVIVHEIPDGELVTLPVPVPVPVSVTMPGGGMRYVISPTRGCDIDTWHGLPIQSPLHPWKMLLPPAICVSVTSVLVGNAPLHTPDAAPSFTVQLMPAGELVMVP